MLNLWLVGAYCGEDRYELGCYTERKRLKDDDEDDESEAEDELLNDDQDAIIPTKELQDILVDQQCWFG